jgi:hypothetical protein
MQRTELLNTFVNPYRSGLAIGKFLLRISDRLLLAILRFVVVSYTVSVQAKAEIVT